jgi:hypothetical protein
VDCASFGRFAASVPLRAAAMLKQENSKKPSGVLRRVCKGLRSLPDPRSERSGMPLAVAREQRRAWLLAHGSSYRPKREKGRPEPCPPAAIEGAPTRLSPILSAAWRPGDSPGPWLCAPAFRRVCPFEDKEATSMRSGRRNREIRPTACIQTTAFIKRYVITLKLSNPVSKIFQCSFWITT